MENKYGQAAEGIREKQTGDQSSSRNGGTAPASPQQSQPSSMSPTARQRRTIRHHQRHVREQNKTDARQLTEDVQPTSEAEPAEKEAVHPNLEKLLTSDMPLPAPKKGMAYQGYLQSNIYCSMSALLSNRMSYFLYFMEADLNCKKGQVLTGLSQINCS